MNVFFVYITSFRQEKFQYQYQKVQLMRFFLMYPLNGTEVLLCGDGAADFFMTYRSSMLIIAPPQGRLQNACGVCLGAMSKKFVSPDELEVSYLQKVKAEKDLENKNK